MPINQLRQKLLIPLKEKYSTGNYIIVSGKHVIVEPNWECFDLQETYIHKKDKEVLEAFLRDSKIKIEYCMSHDIHSSVWDAFYLDFILDYDEDYEYRLKDKEW